LLTCTFIGHSNCSEKISTPLYLAVERLITEEGVTRFLVGDSGNFDYYTYQVLKKLHLRYDIQFEVVLSYLNRMTEFSYYSQDETLFPSVLENTPPRFAISKRNTYMLKSSQYLVCLLEHTFSNSYTFVKKALKSGMKVINLGAVDINSL